MADMEKNRISLVTLALSLFIAPPAFAGPVSNVVLLKEQNTFTKVDVDCYAIGQDKAAELGGELAKASPDTADGVPVCHIVVLVPAKDGARPQRVEVDVPQ